MADKSSSMILDLTPEERQRIEDLARRRGYSAPEEYLLALIEADALVIGVISSEADEDEDEFDLEEALRESWHQAMTGQTRPISDLWDALDDDE